MLVERPAPSASSQGSPLGDFEASGPFDTPPDSSEEPRLFVAGGSLYVEKLENFFNAGAVPQPKLTRRENGEAVVHIWVNRPAVRLIETKCLYARTLRFSIPSASLVGVNRLLVVNHDTNTQQVLAEKEVLAGILHAPQVASANGVWQTRLPTAGAGCGA